MGMLATLLLSVASAPPVAYIISVALFAVDAITYYSKE